ncbi:MAG: NAD(P)-dependent alcohol dehydrogenase [Bacteroidetes bacterium]|nr:NAD(P)-dependent alcohol dehydrogenase [Bacteroidota bacterium]MBS1541194.1 NAD(P)-dependent alcohol dehydrogenase [Bacteroidota bacterium]
MATVKAYAAQSETTPLAPFSISRRAPFPHDVVINILYCGVCHSDIHQVRNEWGDSIFPMVPGHEIVGKVAEVGAAVKKFKKGDMAAVGCLVDSCRTCANCSDGLEQFCETHSVPTYNGYEMDRKTPTYGGYSKMIVVDEAFTLKVSDKLDLAGTAPLLCAGITTYSPLRHWKVGKGDKVAVAGLGGLGHMGVKFAAAFGAEVTVLSTSASKEHDARRLGAHHFVVTSNQQQMKSVKRHFNFILNTVSAPHDYDQLLGLLKTNGTMVVVGVPPDALPVSAFSLIAGRRSLAGSLIGGIKETQEMLDYCAQHGITSDVEVIRIQDIETAYDRMIRGDVRYRFVIDLNSL